MSETKRTNEELKRLQELPLAEKITLTKLRITEFYEHYNGNVIVSFSGGKDSTVLLHLVRSLYPEVKAVYCDTGLEYPEVKNHVKQTDNVEIIRPEMSFKEALDKYGWLFPSKEIAQVLYYAKQGKPWALRKMDAVNKDGSHSYYKEYYKKWKFLIDAPFKIGHQCCDVMKKKPFKKYMRLHGGGAYIGTLASESMLRRTSWKRNGCNSFQNNKGMPLSFWTEQDILKYVKDNNLSIPRVYGKIVEVKGKLKTTGVARTGCVFCPAGIHHDRYPNRFQRMAKTHPKIYDYCLNELGLKEVLDYVGVDYELHDQPCLFEVD